MLILLRKNPWIARTKLFLQLSWLHLPGSLLSGFYGTDELCLFVTLTGKETGLVWIHFSSFFFSFMSGLFHVTYVFEIFHIAICNIHLSCCSLILILRTYHSLMIHFMSLFGCVLTRSFLCLEWKRIYQNFKIILSQCRGKVNT